MYCSESLNECFSFQLVVLRVCFLPSVCVFDCVLVGQLVHRLTKLKIHVVLGSLCTAY